MSARTTVFVSYSHVDSIWLERLRTHLTPLNRAGLIDLWDDTKILPGEDWRVEIENALARARVAVLLITADFVASEFITSNELPRLLASAESGGATILPVIIGRSRIDLTPVSRFQSVNPPDRPLNGMTKASRESALVEVANAVERAFAGGPTVPRVGIRAPDDGDADRGRTVAEDGSERADSPSIRLNENDPLDFFSAVAALPMKDESYDLILDTGHYSRAHDGALRAWLARDVDRSGTFLTETIRDSPSTGAGWRRARRAGQLFSRPLRFLEPEVYELLRSGRIESVRHALVAYGNLAQSLSPPSLRTDILIGSYAAQKALSYAVEGWTAAYVMSRGWEIGPRGDDLRACMEWYWTDFSSTWPKPAVDLRPVNSAHYDDLINKWIDHESPPYIKDAALRALGERGVTRAVGSISRLLTTDDLEIRQSAARALGRIGGPGAARALRAIPPDEPCRDQIVHVAHEFDDPDMDEIVERYGADGEGWTDLWLARSIGLADAGRHQDLIMRNLGSRYPDLRGVSAIAAARMALPVDWGRVVDEAEPGAERAMAIAALVKSTPGDYGGVQQTWRKDLVDSLQPAPARLIEDIFDCVAGVPEAAALVEAWRPVVASWGARI